MFIIEIPYLDLEQINKNRIQTLRWQKIRPYKYAIPFDDKIIMVEQNKTRFAFSCSEEDFWNIWYYYFDLDFDYEWANMKIKSYNEYLKKCSVVSKGVRILNQNPFEVLITSILLEHMSIKQAKRILNNICMVCCKKRRNSLLGIPVSWYEFPTPTQILNNAEDLSFIKLDYCVEEILSVCMFLENGSLSFISLGCYEDAIERFKELSVISQVTANRVLLFGLGYKDAFPMTSRIKEIMNIENITKKDLKKNKQIRGLINQYIMCFENTQRNLKKV